MIASILGSIFPEYNREPHYSTCAGDCSFHGADGFECHFDLASGYCRRYRHQPNCAEAGAHRLSCGACGFHSGKRLDGGQVWREERVSRSYCGLCGRLHSMCRFKLASGLCDRPFLAGYGRGDDDAGWPPGPHPLHAAKRACFGHGVAHHSRHGGAACRPAGGWLHNDLPHLALDIPHQRADWHDRHLVCHAFPAR